MNRNQRRKHEQRKTKSAYAVSLRQTPEWKAIVDDLRHQLRKSGCTEAEIEMGVSLSEQQAMKMLRDAVKL